MDSSFTIEGSGVFNQGHVPAIEYTAQVVSPIVNGEVKLTVSEQALTATAYGGDNPFRRKTVLR